MSAAGAPLVAWPIFRREGLGGDSEIRADNRAMTPSLLLGPRRAIPLCLLARENPEIKKQLAIQLEQLPST